MKSIRYTFCLLLILTTSFSGCTPEYGAQFYIHNNTDQKLRVVYRHFRPQSILDTTYISAHEEMFFAQTWNETSARNIDEYMVNLESITFDTLHISLANNGSPYKKDALDIQNWLKIIPENGKDIGTVRLTVNLDDF